MDELVFKRVLESLDDRRQPDDFWPCTDDCYNP